MSQHIPRKRFGQNFLQDAMVINDIVNAVNPRPADRLLEIGPGLAAITEPLLARCGHVHVVEIDRDIAARLAKRFSPAQLTIHNVDALQFDFGALATMLGGPLRIVGNLPYNISTPLLFHLASFNQQVLDMHFMLQKEVVERMVAAPGCNDYGRLSVMLQYRFYLEWLLDVPPTAFYPPPKVDSAVVRLIPLPQPPALARDYAKFEAVVAQAFSQRRKTLRNTLKGWLDDAGFAALGIDPGQRAETLSVAQYVAIANHLSPAA